VKLRPKTGRPHRGAVLILVLVMLALLAMLAISLATTSALDRNVSHNYIDEVRARLVAKAGIEHAIARIQSSIQRGNFEDAAMIYWGNKVSEDGDPDVVTPLMRANNPSFAIEDESPQNPDDDKTMPIQFKFEDRDVGISGALSSSTYGVNSDIYRLRVSDANSRINVNDGLDDPDVTKNLKRILNHLGAACKVKEAGERLIAKRPRIGYRTRKELKAVLGEDDFAKVGHHITPYAWRDKDLVNPVPLSQTCLGSYPVDYNSKLSLYRYGRSRTSDGSVIDRQMVFAPEYTGGSGFDHAIMALDEVNAQWISRTSRSPVNVNGASVEVLTALIADLRGFFMTERRKKNPGGGEYTFMFYPKHTNMPGGAPIGAELGFLYSTPKFIGPAEEQSGSTAGSEGSVSARVIAEEIIACRVGGKSRVAGFDYGSAWFGGPFRTWRQFNGFCDSLVEREILADGRAIFFDYTPTDGGSGWFSGDCGADTLVPSPSQPKVAAQAMADVLKANFNPNCTLNELNPDANMFREVDKTDLLCNSTEFCFTPMGYFDIECEGLIIKTPRGDDLMRARMGMIQSRETIECVVKVYDVYRETTQSDFSKGDLGPTVRRLMTNSNKPLETGPEPEAGETPEECRWSGWIQLSTIGGIRRPEAKNAVMSTPKSKDPELGASAFGHFQFDHRLNFHASDQQHPLQFSGGFGNQPDRTEQHAGPYNPTRGGRGEFRLARDWTQADIPGGADYKAMSDLRIDGAYIERDGALLYPCTPEVFATEGTIAFWLKPAFRPGMTGKPRTFFSTDTFITEGGSLQQGWQLINGLWFFAAHDHMAYTTSANEFSSPSYAGGPWRPVCLCSGYATRGSYGGGVGHQTPSLNHTTHQHGGPGGVAPGIGNPGDVWNPKDMVANLPTEPMEHHQWMHVAYNWDMGGQNVKIMVNGVTYQGPEVLVHPQPTSASDWTSENAVFRLGEPSSTMSYGGSRNWTVDGTMDEFYMWKGGALDTAAQLFDRGRYHLPRFGQEGFFTSQPILHDAIHGQRLPEPTAVRPPIRPRAEGSGRTTTSGPMDVTKAPDVMRPICAFWTYYGQAVDMEKLPIMLDHSDWPGPPTALKIAVSLQLLLDGEPVGEMMADDGGSSIEKVTVKKEQKLQYRLKVFLPDAVGGSILLSTPVIDDVTIFYTQGVEYIHYNRVEMEP
jgi:hypothetical protein